MRVKVSELSGIGLDWAVAQATRVEVAMRYGRELAVVHDRHGIKLIESIRSIYSPSTNWAQGGPLIERFDITIIRIDGFSQVGPLYQVMQSFSGLHLGGDRMMPVAPTRLIAACRAIVAAKLGDEIDLPEGLV